MTLKAVLDIEETKKITDLVRAAKQTLREKPSYDNALRLQQTKRIRDARVEETRRGFRCV